MMVRERLWEVTGMSGEHWACRAVCRGCGEKVYSVSNLPTASKPEVERLLVWLRGNTRAEHERARPDCKGFRLRWRWSRYEPGALALELAEVLARSGAPA